MYEDVDKRDEGTGGVSCTDGDTRQDRRELFHGGGGGGGWGGSLNKNSGYRGLLMTKNYLKKHWLNHPKAVPKKMKSKYK